MARNKSKILLYFLIGVALPCLLLSYFAFRGIQNDRALYEQQMLHENQAMAQRVIETIHHQFDAIDQDYRMLIASLSAAPDSTLIAALGHFKAKHNSVENIFSIRSAPKKVELPGATLLFTDQANAYGHHFQHRSTAMAAGLRHEFQEHSFSAAIHNYQAALSQTLNQNEQAEIVAAIARAQKKNQSLQAAIQSYQILWQRYNSLYSVSGVPFGLAARNELGSLYAATKDTLAAIQTFLTALNEISRNRWQFNEMQYQFWSRLLQDSLNNIFTKVNLMPPFSSYLNRFQRIQEELQQQEQRTNRLLKFQAEAGKLLAKKLALKLNDEQWRFQIILSDQNYFITVLDQSSADRENRWGIIWRSDAIQDSVRHILNQQKLQLNQVVWQVMDNDHQIILQSTAPATSNAQLLVRTTFLNNFPDWTLELYHQNPTLIESLLSSRRSIYFYTFLLIAGILAFGLILTNRSISQELELARMKSDFVSRVSHELKSPLTSIRQLAEMLQTGRVPTEERRQKYYDVIVEQSKRLALMISNVLDFARMEAGKKQFDFEPTDMRHFLQEIVAGMQQQVSYDGFEFTLQSESTLPLISIDRQSIAQAITNLLDNAIKYSHDVKRIVVRLFLADDFLNISVQDFGIGISPKELNKIFDRFYRVNHESVRSKRGSGLGLTLVQQIVKAHYGSVAVASEIGRGSTFTIKLPI